MKVQIEAKMLSAYIHAVNQIDDYFEYANESTKDRAKVKLILTDLTKKILEAAGAGEADETKTD